MAQTNFTDDENQKAYIELRCSAEFLRSVDGEPVPIINMTILNLKERYVNHVKALRCTPRFITEKYGTDKLY